MNTDVRQLPQSGTAQMNGWELYYEVHGDGPALVLVMGIGYDSSLWTLAQVPARCTQFRGSCSTTATPDAVRTR